MEEQSSADTDHDRAAITFDDGFQVLMGDCLDLLEQAGVRATFFIPAGFSALADSPEQAASFSLRRHCYTRPLSPIGPDNLRRLAAAGHCIGSHTVTHTSIRDMSPERARWELETSKAMLEQWTERPVTAFAYPYGHVDHPQFNPADWLKQAGYQLAVSLRRGRVNRITDRFYLPREHVEGSWPVRDLVYFCSR